MEDASATAVTKANTFASAAEDYSEIGQIAQAIEAHFRAAEQFLLATTYTTDPDAAKTLRLLYANHTRKGKDLQRRHAARPASAPTPTLPVNSPTVTPALLTPQSTIPQSQPTSERQQQQPSQNIPKQSDHIKLASKQESAVRREADDIARNKTLHQQQQQQQGVWADAFAAGDTESLSGYGSQHFFVGQSDETKVATATAQTRRAPSPLSNKTNYAAPATVAVESLDASVVQPRTRFDQSPSHQRPLDPRSANSNMTDTIGSYYVLDHQQQAEIPHAANEEPSDDPFTRFWDVVENLVQKIPPLQSIPQSWSPTAAPMPMQPSTGRTGYAGQGNPVTQPQMFENLRGFKGPPQHPALSSLSPKQKQQTQSQQQQLSPSASISGNLLNSYYVVNSNYSGGVGGAASYLGGTGAIGYDPKQTYPDGGDVRLVSDGDGGHQLVRGSGPSSAAPGVPRKLRSVGGGSDTRNVMGIRAKTLEELQIENDQLKQTVDMLSKRLATLEKADQENNMLKSSIIQFRQDWQRQAKRYAPPATNMAASTGLAPTILPPRYNSVDAAALSKGRVPPNSSPSASGITSSQGNVGSTGIQSNDATAALARVAALEEEIRQQREQHEQEVSELTKYKERWLKVKDSARRKKEEKAATEFISGGRDDGGGASLDASMTSSSTTTSANAVRASGSGLDQSTPSPSMTPSPSRKSFPLAAELPFSSSSADGSLGVGDASMGPDYLTSSQLKTPIASTIGLPPHAPKVQPLNHSLVMDSSAALLSSHLMDPTVASKHISTAATPTAAGSRSLHSNMLHVRTQNGARPAAAGEAVPPPDLNESSASSLFYSAHSFRPPSSSSSH